MTAQIRHASARAAALVAAAVAVIFGSLAIAAPASAHDQLVSSDPAADSSIDALPTEMTLVFSGELIDAGDGNAVEVLSPSGHDVVDGPIELSGPNVTVPLVENREAGSYAVTWRVVSNDGHPVDGTFGFSVSGDVTGTTQDDRGDADGGASDGERQKPTEQPEATAQPSEEASSSASDPYEGTPADGASFLSNAPWIIVGIVVVAGGGAVLALLVGRRRRLRGDDTASGDDPSSDDSPSSRDDRP